MPCADHPGHHGRRVPQLGRVARPARCMQCMRSVPSMRKVHSDLACLAHPRCIHCQTLLHQPVLHLLRACMPAHVGSSLAYVAMHSRAAELHPTGSACVGRAGLPRGVWSPTR